MDRGEVVPGHAELGLRFFVVADQLVDRSGRDDLPVRKRLRDRAAEHAQLLASLEAAVYRGARLLGERGKYGVLPLRVVLKPAVRELLEVSHPGELCAGDVRVVDR